MGVVLLVRGAAQCFVPGGVHLKPCTGLIGRGEMRRVNVHAPSVVLGFPGWEVWCDVLRAEDVW